MLRTISALPLQTASDPGERVILGAQKWSGRISVSGEAGWADEPAQRLRRTAKMCRTTTSKRPELFAVDTTG